MLSDLEIVKYPYLGYSPSLIEYFLIIGHEKSFIRNEILPNYFNDPKQIYEPTILNSISANTDIDMLDNDMIIKLIYPKTPSILSTNNLQFEHPSTSVIFFLNADTIGVNSKIPFHGCAFLFYEYFVINSTKIFVPKTFCIISQYPFFSLFNTINKEVLSCFRSKNEIPLEIILYNIINFIPSPINFSMNISMFPHKELNAYANRVHHHMSTSSSGKESSFTGGNSGVLNANANPFHKSSSTHSQSSSHSSHGTGSHSHPIVQLNGYPVLDFNISEIFNILPMNMVVEILIFNFLEFDMLFFSKNLEILNFTMYIIATLNYPCNDSIYLWHILSVSLDELLSSDTSQFVGKPWAAMMGVNCTYNNNIDSCKVMDSHFVVDIDNKQFFLKHVDNNEDVVKATTLLAHIRRIMKDYNVQSHFLAKNIKQLLKELDIISKQVINSTTVNNSQTSSDSHISFYSYAYGYSNSQTQSNSHPQISFFDTGDKVKILNKNIQEAFYDFILNILIVFYNNYFLNSSFDKKKIEGQSNSNFFIHYNEDISKFSKEEKNFYDFFKASNKYNNYILNFIQEFKCINLYKVPLIFSEEFIYLKKNNEEKVFKSRFFEIIENFYYESTCGVGTYSGSSSSFTNNINSNNYFRTSNPNLTNNNSNSNTMTFSCSKKPIHINFNQFFSYYENNLKKYFFEEISNLATYSNSSGTNNLNSLSIKPSQVTILDKIKYVYEYEVVELDSDILFRYVYHLNNMTEETKEEVFPSVIYRKGNDIKSVKFYEIVDTIERNLITHKIIKSDHLIIFSLILIFIVTRSNCNFNESIAHLRDILELLDSKNFFLRKYINLILGIYNNFEEKDQSCNGLNRRNSSIKKCQYINKMCNFIIINFLRNKNILPNEQMMKLFENFTLQSEQEDEDFAFPDSILEEEESGMMQHDLEKFNLFLTYHFCTHGIKKADYFLKLGENTSYDGDLFLECCATSQTKTGLSFKFDFSNKILTTEIFSPLKLYNLSYKIYNSFLDHQNFSMLDKEALNKIIINIIFYCKNMNMTYKFLLKFLQE